VTEADWLRCTDPGPMLEFLRGRASERKLRLFACACCRSVWHLLTDERSRRAVETVECKADGGASNEDFYAATLAAEEDGTSAAWAALYATLPDATRAATECATCAAEAACHTATPADARAAERARQAQLLLEVFGNPFHLPSLPSELLAWNDGTLPRLARAIYDERAFDQLPILADALEDAGCDNAGILNHCRQSGVHVRGCWVIDLLLGKE
jgi:hypothetical protein